MLVICSYIELVKKYGLEISQPSLDTSRGTTWAMTKHRGDVEVHKYVVLYCFLNVMQLTGAIACLFEFMQIDCTMIISFSILILFISSLSCWILVKFSITNL